MSSTTDRTDWYEAATCRLDDLARLVAEPVGPGDVPHADRIERGVPVYSAATVRAAAAEPASRRRLLAEIAWVFRDGPGIAAFPDAVPVDTVDRVTRIFFEMIDEQNAKGTAPIDHYAKPGANDRVWNVIEKLAVLDPEAFVDYYASEGIAVACEAWLGPWYQVTSQINCVNPGGEAQRPHRDYHLGFLSDADAERFPPHVHELSGLLTLQGAVAHCAMPVETGPTKLLPHSQKYGAGYVAWRRPEFVAFFEEHFVQLELAPGDAVFFNPAVFHAAGTNRTPDVRRIANLLQVSSGFGRAMESVDRYRMALAIYPSLARRRAAGHGDRAVANALAAAAEGYAFPTSLDFDPPVGGLAPPTQADVVRRALDEGWPVEQLAATLEAHAHRRRTH